MNWKAFFTRVGRNAAGIGIGIGVGIVNEKLGVMPIPAQFQFMIPLVVGPTLNAIAKTGRELLEPGVAQKICKAF